MTEDELRGVTDAAVAHFCRQQCAWSFAAEVWLDRDAAPDAQRFLGVTFEGVVRDMVAGRLAMPIGFDSMVPQARDQAEEEVVCAELSRRMMEYENAGVAAARMANASARRRTFLDEVVGVKVV